MKLNTCIQEEKEMVRDLDEVFETEFDEWVNALEREFEKQRDEDAVRLSIGYVPVGWPVGELTKENER